MRCLERDSTGAERADLTGPPPLPPPNVPPPGFNPFGRALVSPTREATSLSVTAPGLVKPRAATAQNPLLASSSAASRATGLTGEEHLTKEHLASALFPTRPPDPKGYGPACPAKLEQPSQRLLEAVQEPRMVVPLLLIASSMHWTVFAKFRMKIGQAPRGRYRPSRREKSSTSFWHEAAVN